MEEGWTGKTGGGGRDKEREKWRGRKEEGGEALGGERGRMTIRGEKKERKK